MNSKVDTSMFIRFSNKLCVIVLSDDVHGIQQLLSSFKATFSLKDLGELSYFFTAKILKGIVYHKQNILVISCTVFTWIVLSILIL